MFKQFRNLLETLSFAAVIAGLLFSMYQLHLDSSNQAELVADNTFNELEDRYLGGSIRRYGLFSTDLAGQRGKHGSMLWDLHQGKSG